jgi:hypothetical protein
MLFYYMFAGGVLTPDLSSVTLAKEGFLLVPHSSLLSATFCSLSFFLDG